MSCRLLKGSERKLAPMTVSSPNVIEIKLDRVIDDMRLLRSQMIAFDKRPERDRSLSQTKRTTAREQIETMVRGGCYRDGKDSFDFLRSRGSNRRSFALSGNMSPTMGDCER